MKTIIYSCGVYSLLLGVFHIFFWKLLRWKNELKKISSINSAAMQIMNSRLIYYFFFVAIVSFMFPNEILRTKLGSVFLIGNSLFWFGRTIEQFIFFKTKNIKVNLLTLVFIIGLILFTIPLINF